MTLFAKDWRELRDARRAARRRAPWDAEIVKFFPEMLGPFGTTAVAGALLVIAVEAVRWLTGW